METIKAGRPVVDFIKLCYKANRSPLLEGKHGLGKSELLEQAAAEMGIDFIVRDLSLMEPPDLVGIPRMNGKTTKYLPPDFLPTGGKGILCFEELNRAEKYMIAPCLQLLTARMLNDYCLPAGWLPAAAINPAEDEGYDVHDLDLAMLSRFVRAPWSLTKPSGWSGPATIESTPPWLTTLPKIPASSTTSKAILAHGSTFRTSSRHMKP